MLSRVEAGKLSSELAFASNFKLFFSFDRNGKFSEGNKFRRQFTYKNLNEADERLKGN